MGQESVFKAVEFAARAHRGQFRKGTRIPYLIHPLSVAKILIQCGCRDEVVVAGLLHDTVEDTEVELADIERIFGAQVARWVEGVSEPDKSIPWESRKRHTLETLERAPAELVMLAAADKLDNLRSMQEDLELLGPELWQRFNRPKAAQEWYYRSLLELLGRRLTGESGAWMHRALAAGVGYVFADGRT